MSRNFFPAAMAIGLGVFTGYYTFQPALKDIQSERGSSQGGPRPGQQPINTKEDSPVPPPTSGNDPKDTGK